MKTTINTDLPILQKRFIQQFDGTIESVINFDLAKILCPAFSSHYFYVSGTTMENTITTKDTDGSWAYWGNQTQVQVNNAYVLAHEVREFIMTYSPMSLEDRVGGDHGAMRKYGSKISQVRRRATLLIDGQIVLIPGMKI